MRVIEVDQNITELNVGSASVYYRFHCFRSENFIFVFVLLMLYGSLQELIQAHDHRWMKTVLPTDEVDLDQTKSQMLERVQTHLSNS